MPTNDRRRRLTESSIWPALLIAMLLAGCGKQHKYPTAHLAGNVSIDGQPIESGKIVFLPRGDTAGPTVGAEIRSGHYDCREVPRGALVVQILAVRPSGKTIDAMGKSFPELINIVPPPARAGLEIAVDGDNLGLDFPL